MYYSQFKTPLGNMVSCSTDKGIQMLLFEDEAQDFLKKIHRSESIQLIESRNDHLDSLKIQLDEYFSGKRRIFDIQTDLLGSEFQKNVWEIVRNISFGETSNYGNIALEMGGMNYTRAVAGANAQNNILLMIPCHRVIGNGNKLTGYRGGLERKKWLIQFEKSFIDRKEKNTLF